jgi:hypothetical protein
VLLSLTHYLTPSALMTVTVMTILMTVTVVKSSRRHWWASALRR